MIEPLRSLRVPWGMLRSLLVLIAIPLCAPLIAQCFCADINVQIMTPTGPEGERDAYYLVREDKVTDNYYRYAERDSIIKLRVQTGGGLEFHEWRIAHASTGAVMNIRLLHMAADTPYPTIRIPFREGSYSFDMDELGECYAAEPHPPPMDGRASLVPCKGGQLAIHRGNERYITEVLDLHGFEINAK